MRGAAAWRGRAGVVACGWACVLAGLLASCTSAPRPAGGASSEAVANATDREAFRVDEGPTGEAGGVVASGGAEGEAAPLPSPDAPAGVGSTVAVAGLGLSDEAWHERAIAMLQELAISGEPAVRANALEALSGEPSAAREAVRLGLVDANEGVRGVAVAVAGRAGLEELLEQMRPMVNDPSPHVRALSVLGLWRMGEEVDPTPLADLLLEHPDARVRSQAAFVLGELREPSALPMLRRALGEPAASLGVEERSLLSLQIAEAMVKLGDAEAMNSVRAALFPTTADDLESTALAVQIIGEIGDRQSLGQLVTLAAMISRGQHMPPEIRLGAVIAASKLGDRQGSFLAEEHVVHERAAIRAQAATALGLSGSRASLSSLDTLMRDRSPTVRASAAAAVLRLLSDVQAVSASAVGP